MGDVVFMMGMSLDGYFEGPDGDISWHVVNEELHSYLNAYIKTVGAFLNGRVVYEHMAAFWPTADADPDAPAAIVEFAEIWRTMPKFVFSRTLQTAAWNSLILREVDPARIRELKAQTRADLLLGGADLAAEFLRLDLIDEFRILVHPVLVGAGRQLFPQPGVRAGLRLIETRRFENGVVQLLYRRGE